MMKIQRFVGTIFCLAITALTAAATDYTTLLTTERGFTEVTAFNDIIADPSQCYILTSAENTELIVGIGRYEAKPDWASEETKALRYKSAATDPVLDLTNFFTIEKNGQYIGLRNLVYNSSLFQTHDNAGYMYVLTYTEPTMSDWCYLTPTYQNGYWLFESGKYPISSNNWACGYLGPWNKLVVEGQPIALNRRNTADDEAGHYRMFKIAKDNLLLLRSQLLSAASSSHPVDFTGKIINPSFETGDETGWTMIGRNDDNTEEFTVRGDYGMTNKHGSYLMNAYQWWSSNIGVSQTISDLPSGLYELTGVVATWVDRTVYFTANEITENIAGQGDQTGINASVTVRIGQSQKLDISAGSTAQWWVEGHSGESQTFFKLDNVQLHCKGVWLNGVALPLPNDRTTILLPNQWYYYDVNYPTDYWLIGNINGMVCSTDGEKLISEISTTAVSRKMTLSSGRVYFKTTRDDATLQITTEHSLNQGSFTVTALNVDGLPNTIATIDLNPDGPGSDGTKKISQYLASKNYDFIGVSEDFNYHGSLMQSLNTNYSSGTVRATLSITDLPWDQIIQLKFRFDTDGLNLIWKNDKTSAANESWTMWNDMEATDGNQYVKKGFRHYDMTIDNEIVIDVYVLHMDAGDTNATWSRESQWRQLTDAINDADANRPKLIIGDTNSRWTRENITTNFMNLLSPNITASDVWVEFYRNGIYPTTDMADLTDGSNPTNYTNYEIVDKIIYINPKAANTVQLVPKSFRIEQDYTYGTVNGTDDTTPLGDHKPVVVEFDYYYVGDELLSLSLNDKENNSQAIADINGINANVTLQGRKLYKDGSWNTLCLPFNAALTGPLAEATVQTLKSATFDNGTLTLTFDGANSIVAGQPYIIKWNNTSGITENPEFTDVVIGITSPATISAEAANFVGTYDYTKYEADDRSILFMGDANTLYYPKAGASIGAFRAYFALNGNLTAGDVNLTRFLFADEEQTAISDPMTSVQEDEQEVYYTLDGVRLKGKPNTKGIYVRSTSGNLQDNNKGIKVVIK